MWGLGANASVCALPVLSDRAEATALRNSRQSRLGPPCSKSQLPTHRMSGLEVAGAVLAVPGLIDVIVRGGEAVYDRLETFKTVDKAIARCHSLHNVALCLKY